MSSKLPMLALILVLLSGCKMIKDNVINPIKSIFSSRTPSATKPVTSPRPAPPVAPTAPIPDPPKRNIAGVYEHRQGGVIYRRVLLKNGIMEYYLHNTKAGESRWSEENGEILVTPDGGKITDYLKLEPTGDLSWIATTQNGARHEIEKLTFRKIK